MPSTFNGLQIALSALWTQQRAIEVVDHNIANANTEGYSRQKAVMTATDPYTVPAMNREQSVGQLGTGVTVSKIYRYSSEYLNSQLRDELTRENRWQAIENGYSQLETIFAEPSDTGIATALGSYWQAWSDLSAMPDDLAARTAATEAASNLAYAIRDANDRLAGLQSDMDLQISQAVSRINDIAIEVSRLNDTIGKVQAFGDSPNDLRDTRDQLLNELSGLVDINYMENEDGTVAISIGGHSLVMGNEYGQLEVEADAGNGMLATVKWTDSGTSLVIHGVSVAGGLEEATGTRVGGQLGGAMYVRDVLVPQQREELDNLARALIQSTNALHATGYGVPNDNTEPPSSRPGSTASDVVVDAAGPVADIIVDGVTYTPNEGLGGGSYSVVTRDNAGVAEFRVLDATGNALSINNVSGSGTTGGWQALTSVLGTTYDSGRGFAIEFNAAAGTVGGEAASFDYNNFFNGSSAADIGVSDWVTLDPNNVATAATGDAIGDGSIALAISRLQTALTVDGEYTLDTYYAASITSLGLASKQASNMVANTESMHDYLQTSIDSTAAVDLDEEAVNLIQYQRAYQGAARVMTAIDEMLDRLINGTGRVGL
ncbi:MAG: flagellar hook-associated protein FlgK [Anaerolineae bacterium]